jgi:hypothetical protein
LPLWLKELSRGWGDGALALPCLALPCLALPCLALPKQYERPCNRQAIRLYSTKKQCLDSKSLVFDFRLLVFGFWFLVS